MFGTAGTNSPANKHLFVDKHCGTVAWMGKVIKVGEIGENLACHYLESKGYKILGRNYRKKWGEIDIIAKAKDKTLVFVEVKAVVSAKTQMVGGNEITPEDNLTTAKLRKLWRVCEIFANEYSALVDDKKGWRIDLVAVDLTNDKKNCTIKHYENI